MKSSLCGRELGSAVLGAKFVTKHLMGSKPPLDNPRSKSLSPEPKVLARGTDTRIDAIIMLMDGADPGPEFHAD